MGLERRLTRVSGSLGLANAGIALDFSCSGHAQGFEVANVIRHAIGDWVRLGGDQRVRWREE